jgi:hypothetical protein
MEKKLMQDAAVGYLDECGDLGWKLDKPFQDGGSSQYFVISLVLGVGEGYRRFAKIINALHLSQKWTSKHEKKWTTIADQGRRKFCELISGEIDKKQNIILLAVVFKKDSLPSFFDKNNKGSAQVLYAAMVASLVDSFMQDSPHLLRKLSYCPDELNNDGRILESLLEYQLLLKSKFSIGLKRMVYQKAMDGGLNCADMVAGAVWEAFEHGNNEFLDIIRDRVAILELF